MRPQQEKLTNRILARLKRADFKLVSRHLEYVELPLRKNLETRKRRIENVYFPEYGFASVVAGGTGGRDIEVGLIGREGVTGLAVIMGTDRSPYETFIQSAGDGWCMPARNLRACMDQSPALSRVLLHYGYAFSVQIAHTALANGRNKLEERLARWILMAADRLDGNDLPLTHEFLALMLGVRRPGVTLALKLLAKQGLIQNNRRTVRVVDRKGLIQTANGAYGAPEAEFHRLFG